MSMETNLQGRLRNTVLPLTSGLLPLFEAVVNSIHAIEEAGLSSTDGSIRIAIERTPDGSKLALERDDKRRGPEPEDSISGLTITDNGIGFTDMNLKSFKTLDSDYKAHHGCRGIGRLLWLKAFDEVVVQSVYSGEGGALLSRHFRFTPTAGVCDEQTGKITKGDKRSTIVSLMNFHPRYSKNSYKKADAIANAIVEHSLWYFIRKGGAPKIVLVDGLTTINLCDVYEAHMHTAAVSEEIKIKGKPFTLLHIKSRATASKDHTIVYCADKRVVSEEKCAGKISGLHGRLSDASGEFMYSCYVNSNYLDESAKPDRTGFNILEDAEIFAKTELTFSDIRTAVLARATAHLSTYLTENRKKSMDRVRAFVSAKAPRYRIVLGRVSPDVLDIDPKVSDKDLDVFLHKHWAEIEGQVLSEGHDLMKPRLGEGVKEYEKRLSDYLAKAEELKKSDLANYVSHRRVILDLMEMAIRRGTDGRYAREDLIHGLIIPMRKDSLEVPLDSCNLWLIDERLAFHNYLASDKPLSAIPITGSSSTKEPDIVALNVFDNPVLVAEGETLPLASLVVVEIKRPMRDDAAKGEIDDPIEQALGYLDRIRDGKVTTDSGRPIPKSDAIPGFCYLICDITPSIEKRCKIHDLKRTSDGLGFFGYKESYKAYVEVVSFTRLVNAATERNRAFFDKLGLPST